MPIASRRSAITGPGARNTADSISGPEPDPRRHPHRLQNPSDIGPHAPSRHERAFPQTAGMHRYTGWAAGRVCDRGRTARCVARQAHHGNGSAITGSGMGWGRFAAWHVIARSVSMLAGQADTASGRVAGQGECLSRKRWRERADRAGFLRASAGRASICSVHLRVYRAPVTAVRLLDGARSVLGYQTRYAAVGCHHGLQVLQPTR